MFVLLALSLLQTPSPDQHVWERYSVVGNQRWTSAVTQADIDNSPQWDTATTDTPPVSTGGMNIIVLMSGRAIVPVQTK